jgi:uncharacterized protein (TIGR00369 family)
MTDIQSMFGYDVSVPGLERARRWMANKHPGGFFDRLGVYPTEVEEGRVTVACDLEIGHANFIGLVHGGVIAALVDIAGAAAAMSTTKVGESVLTTDINLRLLEATRLDSGRLLAIGRVTHRARKRLVVAVEITRSDGIVAAEGSVGALLRGGE